jgi:hypothetical protein
MIRQDAVPGKMVPDRCLNAFGQQTYHQGVPVETRVGRAGNTNKPKEQRLGTKSDMSNSVEA